MPDLASIPVLLLQTQHACRQGGNSVSVTSQERNECSWPSEHLDCDILPVFIQPPIKLHILNGKGWRVPAVWQWHFRQHLQALIQTILMLTMCI